MMLGALAGALALGVGVGAVQAQNKCLAGKTKCVRKKAACIMKIHEKAEKKGLPLDAAKLQRCVDKFDGGTVPEKGCFEKLEAKNQGPCLTFDDTQALEDKVDAFVHDVVTELDPTPPPGVGPPNKCSSGKMKCVNKKAACILKVHSKAQKLGLPPDAGKLQKCYDKFDGGPVPEKGCFAKLEAKDDGVKPERICPTTGDSATLEAKVDAFVDDVLTELVPVLTPTPTPTPSPMTVFVTSADYDGSLGSGFSDGADVRCQDHADAAGLHSVYRAWISGGFYFPNSMFTQSAGPYVRVDGTKVADDWNDLTDGTLDAPIRVDENGVTRSVFHVAWTNVDRDGFPTGDSGANDHCLNWASSSSGLFGRAGQINATSENWTEGAQLTCSTAAALYCFEQPTPPCPSGGARVGARCWYLGALGDSCDETCDANSLTYFEGFTRNYAGSSGTNERCDWVLDALGHVGDPTVTIPTCGSGLGCAYAGTTRGRCVTPPTDGPSSNASNGRACACS